MTSMLSMLRPLVAATTLALAGTAAQAALVTYTGQVDSGTLAGTGFSGSFSYAEPGPADDFVALDSFTLEFAGLSFSLASADVTPLAWFAGGNFVGIDYQDLDSYGIGVQLLAGFFDLSEALFSYQVASTGEQGLGGFTSFSTVPEPGTLGLALAGLWMCRRRRAA